jgi:hypothetical protein
LLLLLAVLLPPWPSTLLLLLLLLLPIVVLVTKTLEPLTGSTFAVLELNQAATCASSFRASAARLKG